MLGCGRICSLFDCLLPHYGCCSQVPRSSTCFTSELNHSNASLVWTELCGGVAKKYSAFAAHHSSPELHIQGRKFDTQKAQLLLDGRTLWVSPTPQPPIRRYSML